MERSSSIVLHQTMGRGERYSFSISLSLSFVRRLTTPVRRFSEKFLINHRGGRLLTEGGGRDLCIGFGPRPGRKKREEQLFLAANYRGCEFPLNLTLSVAGNRLPRELFPTRGYKLKQNSPLLLRSRHVTDICVYIKEWKQK